MALPRGPSLKSTAQPCAQHVLALLPGSLGALVNLNVSTLLPVNELALNRSGTVLGLVGRLVAWRAHLLLDSLALVERNLLALLVIHCLAFLNLNLLGDALLLLLGRADRLVHSGAPSLRPVLEGVIAHCLCDWAAQ